MNDYVQVRCVNPHCAMAFPIDPSDPRVGTCPRCQSRTRDVMPYPPPYVSSAAQPHQRRHVELVFDNIRSAQNVGMMLRSADGSGVAHAHHCGITPEPDHPKVTKSSLGAEATVATSQWMDAIDCVRSLSANHVEVWALETTPSSTSLPHMPVFPERLALVVGHERAGVAPDVLDEADAHVHLDMVGTKTSLNVAAALSAALAIVNLPRSEQHRG